MRAESSIEAAVAAIAMRSIDIACVSNRLWADASRAAASWFANVALDIVFLCQTVFFMPI